MEKEKKAWPSQDYVDLIRELILVSKCLALSSPGLRALMMVMMTTTTMMMSVGPIVMKTLDAAGSAHPHFYSRAPHLAAGKWQFCNCSQWMRPGS